MKGWKGITLAALALPGFTQDADSATGEYVPHFDLTGV